MASGSFHGGSSHSGSFHSSGGGGFSGGGYSGGGYHSSGGYHYGGGHGGGGDGSFTFWVFAWGPIILVFIATFGENVVLGYNAVNVLIYWISSIVLYIVWRQYERTEVLREIKRDCHHRVLGYVWHGSQDKNTVESDQKSWAGEYNSYRIVFHDKEFGPENVLKVRALMDRTPGILWVTHKLWIAIGVLSILSSIYFYEGIIPLFENAIMSDEAFAFFDALVFYLPSIICALSALTSLIIMCVKDNLLYECAVRIVNDNKLAEKRIRTETMIANELSEKWYYNICPNCGAKADISNRFCNSCGSSLEVRAFTGGSYSGFHRVSMKEEEK